MKRTFSNSNFDYIFDKCNIVQGDKVLVSSDILKILIEHKKQKKIFNPDQFIKELKNRVGKKGTIMFPTFNWDFCKGKNFYYNKTKSKTGSLSNWALKDKSFKRSKNPIYSFAISGQDKEYICNLEHKSCFGLNSPFGYLIENNGKALFVGMDYKQGLTLVHVAEETVGVDFRYFKEFEGNYFNEKNQKLSLKFRMYVRNLNSDYMTGIDDKLDNILSNKKALTKTIFNKINFCMIDINKTYEVMVKDLRGKQKLIYPKKIINDSK